MADLSDPRLGLFRDLKRSNQNRDSNTFIAEGAKLLDRMLEVGWPLVACVMTESTHQEFNQRLPPDVPIYLLEKKCIEELIGFHFHRGVLTCGRRPADQNWGQWIPPSNAPTTLLLLVDIHDPENVGSIIRTASALGVSAIFRTPLCADPFSRRVLRTSMGGVLLTPIATVPEGPAIIETLRREYQITSWATVLDEQATPLKAIEPVARQLIVVGNEGDGLPTDYVQACDRRVTIPMAAGADSLNVAVATGIMLYELAGPG